MSATPKQLKRVRDLLRRATSTGTVEERRTSALRAAEDIAKYDITIGEGSTGIDESRQKEVPPTSHTPYTATRSPPARGTRSEWSEATAPRSGFCTICGGAVTKGERIWVSLRLGAAIHDWPCLVA